MSIAINCYFLIAGIQCSLRCLMNSCVGSVLSLFSEGRRDCVPGEDWSRGSRSQHRERLSTSLHLVHAHQHPGPEPPVEQFLRQHRDDPDKKKDKGEEKSFFQKYWHYFLIGFLVYTLMGAFAKPTGGEEGGGE